ncbi:hypothetical protein Kpol_299p3 [Vanderwaltozyma polyspora DSM 70294]|uniref:Iron transporter FTH1 n=1 Tax=Vanderwaltozyma polyspora (strain ATCC 22028 / DSM 70294 / BCRC 21397 / CBS 2163 / NBRC 10782 / NRRL Y-8283 / UCD 57-17) TaxID=436907 RepID=A7TSW1_VANPO|nr:uncharacterized protein Kpol_299p3 [Vanderwaltozyma polyspora DSM 70294]EDO14643.1 hypothetical protein Kpol_299p3 [Vanderwaltozyma polyspora DSM 70294]
MAFTDVFSFQIFFIFLRESLEIIVIISILLTIVKQGLSIENDTGATVVTGSSNSELDNSRPLLEDSNQERQIRRAYTVEEEEEIFEHPDVLTSSEENSLETVDNHKLYKKLKTQIISGGALGLILCMFIGGCFIVIFYNIGTDLWSASEHYYEGVLSLVASVIISVMGLFFLRMGKLREKFRIKLASIIYSDNARMLQQNTSGQNQTVKFSEKYAFFILPFVTALREGLEAVVFIGGVGIDQPLSSIPLSMVAAATTSGIFGYFFFRYSASLSLKICLVVATCFLYLIAAGLFSKGVWQLELQDYVNKCGGQDMSEVGNGPGSYDISKSVWHVNCCNGERDGGWMILTAIFGWTNSATYGSVISYNIYWLVLILVIHILLIEEKKGYIPYIPIRWQKKRIMKRLNIAKASLDLNNMSSMKTSPSTLDSGESSADPRVSKDSTTPLISRQDT